MEKGFRGKCDEDDNYTSLYDSESSDSSDSDSDHLGEAHKDHLQDQEIQIDWEGFECGSMSFICIMSHASYIYISSVLYAHPYYFWTRPLQFQLTAQGISLLLFSNH